MQEQKGLFLLLLVERKAQVDMQKVGFEYVSGEIQKIIGRRRRRRWWRFVKDRPRGDDKRSLSKSSQSSCPYWQDSSNGTLETEDCGVSSGRKAL